MTSTDPDPGRSPGLPPVLVEVEVVLGDLLRPRIAVLLDGRDRPAVGAIARRWPAADLTRIDVREQEPRTHVALAAHGPYDAVVDLVPRGAGRRMERLAGHLVEGGVWVARTPDGVRSVRAAESLLAVVRDAEAGDVLALAPSRGRVLERLDGAEWQVRGRFRSSNPAEASELPDGYVAPPMFMRQYADVVVAPRQIVVQGALVLPESFTTVEDHRQRNAMLHNRGVDFVVSPLGGLSRQTGVPEPLPGRWFHLDNHLARHFGHAVSEQISHLWGWQRARAQDPGIGALVFAESGAPTAWQRDLLAAGGVPPEAMHVATGPVRVETLVGCTPMFSRPAFAHPGLLATWDEIGSRLAAQAGEGPWPRRIFLTRRGTKRACRNSEELLAEFSAAGFETVHPEDHRLADQVELVRRAEVVAGFAGSAMFHIAFTGAPKQVIVVSSQSYPAHNEILMSALVGHHLDLVRCEPEIPRIEGRWTRESFHSDFTYRPDREGAFLRSLL